MTYDEIMTGIHDAECKPDLMEHIEKVEAAINRGNCSYGASDWEDIYKVTAQRIEDLDARVIH